MPKDRVAGSFPLLLAQVEAFFLPTSFFLIFTEPVPPLVFEASVNIG